MSNDKGWTAMNLADMEPIDHRDPDLDPWIPVRHRLGVSAFGINAWSAKEVGDRIIEEHDEQNDDPAQSHEELYLVIDGHATFTVGGEEIDAPRGTFVFVKDPSLVRTAFGKEAGTTILSIGAAPGATFDVSPWERKYTDAESV
jgi:hypothetical protein